jgi:hypothetical protein
MKPVAKIVLLIFSSLLVSLGSEAQCTIATSACAQSVPHFVKFGGTLKNPLGAPPSGIVAIKFVIYSTSTRGTPLWQEVQNVQLDKQNGYEVMLGVTDIEGIPLELFASGEPRWLGIQALLPGQDEQPRVLLVSVPYALQAENAQKLGGLPASAFAKVANSTTEPVAPPATAVTGPAVVATQTPSSTSGQEVTISSATVNTIPKFSSSSSLTNSQITDQNGMVSMQNLSNTLFADGFPGGVSAAIAACPTSGCIINAVSPNVNLNLGNIDPGSKVITIYLGPFTYTVNQITLRQGLKIIGMGASGTTLQSVNGNNPVFVLPQTNAAAATNVLLSGFHLAGSAGNTSEDGFLLDTSSTFASGLWYSTLNDIYMDGFAGIALHIRGPNNSFAALTQWVLFNNIVVFRVPGGANALRLEGGVFELRFVNCQFDGQGMGDGTNIYIGGSTGGISGYPWSIVFEGLVSQQAATAVQIDGGLNLTFHGSHHEALWGAYQINQTHNIPTWGVTISDSSFANNVGSNSGSGYVLNVTTAIANQINFTHNQILGSPDAIVKNTNLASISYQDNGSGGTNVPVTSGITSQIVPASTINIVGVHSVGLDSSTTPITTIQSSLGPGETVTFFALAGPFTFGSGGNINLMGADSVTVNGSITFIRNDLTQGLQWTPVSQWSPIR